MQKIFNELIEYTQTHFVFEESMLRANNFYDLDNHILKHKKLIFAVQEYETKFRDGDLSVSQEMIEFLRSWLMSHIMSEDKAYVGLLVKGWDAQPPTTKNKITVRIHWDDSYLTSLSELDSLSKDWIDFMEIIYKKIEDNGTRKELNALFIEMQSLLKSYFRIVESRSIDAAYKNGDVLFAEHQIITENLENLLILAESGDGDIVKSIDSFTISLVDYLNNAHAQFAHFLIDQNSNIQSDANLKSVNESVLDGNNIDWKDSLSIGLTTIDDQHKILIDLISQLASAINENRTKKQIKTLLKAAVDYSEYHFAVEERNFSTYKFSDAAKHISIHRELNADIKAVQDDFISKSNAIIIDRINDFAHKLAAHFITEDIKYVQLFKENGIK